MINDDQPILSTDRPVAIRTAERVRHIEHQMVGKAKSEVMLLAADRMDVRGESLLDALENVLDFGS